MMRKPHEFLHPLQPQYRECAYCAERKSLVCLVCGYCYECHPVIEEIERMQVRIPQVIISRLDDIEVA
jgi:hypothetical protein